MAQIGKEEAFDLSAAKRIWPAILEEVKWARRFAWILLSQNAQISKLDEGTLYLEFASKNSLTVYRDNSIDEVLKKVLRDKFELPWEVKAVSGSNDPLKASANPASAIRRPGQWPSVEQKDPPSGGATEKTDDSGSIESAGKEPTKWPPVAGLSAETGTSRLTEWPEVLAEVRNRRRYAWLVLSNHARVSRFDDETLDVIFTDKAARSNYHYSGVHELLISVLLNRFGKNYLVRSFVNPPGGDIETNL
ncbi:hypothetical protein ACIOMM_19100 [Streptomyces sp. NPDC087908]|uniref:hypothetical protein n=1 Tax=Streptomyces sp. NPDC087908 TaxID=3365820 RepID=UPI0037FD0CCF